MQKFVKDLAPGDILAGAPRFVVLDSNQLENSQYGVQLAALDNYGHDGTKYEYWQATAKVEVETPHLTRAQQVADAMFAMLQRVQRDTEKLRFIGSGDPIPPLREDIQHLLDMIEPPKAPTPEEYVRVINMLMAPPMPMAPGTRTPHEVARDLLRRVPK